jgi:acetyl esterase/lipase
MRAFPGGCPIRVRPTFLALVAGLIAGCSGPQLLNSFTPSGGHRYAPGVTYDAAQRLTLDIYTPVNARNEPVVVFFYGGRWTTGVAADFRFVGQALASQGFVAVVPEYRHYPKVRFPAFVQDAARAVRWTESQIARYGGDPAKIFVMGHSSGAHLAAMLALDPQWLAQAGGDRGRLKGMIGLAGPYDFLPLTDRDLRDMFGPPERYELSQPIAFVDGAHPPLLLLHGEDDTTVRVKNTRNLAAAAKRAGGLAESVVYPEMSHSWIVATLAAPLRGQSDVLERVTDFVRRNASGPPSAIVPTGIEERR